MVIRTVLFFLLGQAIACSAADRLNIVWPTPNPAYAQGKPLEDYIQPTVSGRVQSGLFGCVRNSGSRFHEALDLKPISRDRKGEATDPIYAVMDGVVLHANRIAGNSSYGRYIVIEHRHVEPAVITLYAHLSEIGETIRAGAHVRAGQTIGIMGRSSSGYTIPKQRAHLHFEIGFWLSDDFQSWYDWKKFGSKNTHSSFNGMNITGVNPLDFYDRYRAGTVNGFSEYLDDLPVAYVVRVRSDRIPDFIRRYPSLLEGAMPEGGLAGWEIEFTASGLPKRWRALSAPPEQPGKATIIRHDASVIAQYGCLGTVKIRGENASIGNHTERSLQLLFGFR